MGSTDVVASVEQATVPVVTTQPLSQPQKIAGGPVNGVTHQVLVHPENAHLEHCICCIILGL